MSFTHIHIVAESTTAIPNTWMPLWEHSGERWLAFVFTGPCSVHPEAIGISGHIVHVHISHIHAHTHAHTNAKANPIIAAIVHTWCTIIQALKMLRAFPCHLFILFIIIIMCYNFFHLDHSSTQYVYNNMLETVRIACVSAFAHCPVHETGVIMLLYSFLLLLLLLKIPSNNM